MSKHGYWLVFSSLGSCAKGLTSYTAILREHLFFTGLSTRLMQSCNASILFKNLESFTSQKQSIIFLLSFNKYPACSLSQDTVHADDQTFAPELSLFHILNFPLHLIATLNGISFSKPEESLNQKGKI